MSKSFLIRGARQLLTLHGPAGPRRRDTLEQLGLIEDGSVLVTDGVITNVGPTRRLENLAEARQAEEISAAGRVVMPGFVDSHTHLIAPPARYTDYRFPKEIGPAAIALGGFASAAESLDYVRTTAGKALEASARRTVEALLRHGTTTVEVKSGYGLNEAAETKSLRTALALGDCINVITTFFGARLRPPEYEDRFDEYNAWVCGTLMPKLKSRRLARFADVFCSISGFELTQARLYLEAARVIGLVPKLQADLTSHTGSVSLAVAQEAASADGLNFVNDTEIDLLSRSRTIATLLPGMVHQGSCSRFAPARKLIDAGAAVALASGFNPGVSSTYNMQMVISLACTHMQMSPEEAICAATINGAHAIHEASRCGSLEFGKRADIVMLQVADYREIPYHFGGNLVGLTMRAGQIVHKESAVLCSGG